MADERTPNDATPERAGRAAVRLGARPRMGAAGRLGGEVRAARAPARVLRAATRLSAAPPPEAVDTAWEAPRVGPPPAPPAPAENIAGMSDWEAAWIFGGDAETAIALSGDQEALAS